MHSSNIMTHCEIIRNNLKNSDWEITKDKCHSPRAHRRHQGANGKHDNKWKVYCTNVHLRIIEILITLMYKLSAVKLMPLQNPRILMQQERTKDWVHLLPWAVLTMNSQESSSTGYTPHELFHWGRPAWFFEIPFPEDYKSPVGDWPEHRQDLANLARANLKHVRERELNRRNRTRRPATFKVGDLVLIHLSPSPTWPRNCLQDPYLGPYCIKKIDGSRIHVRCSPRHGGELLFPPKQLRHYNSPDELSWDEWGLSDREVERIDLENAANPEEADQLAEMTADEMAVDGYYVVAGIARHEYKQGWKFLTLWDGYGLSEATWDPLSAFIQPDESINPIFRSYLVENNEGQVLTRAETLSQRKTKN